MKRLISLDVLRGITIFGMILVNNGVGEQQFSTLQHVAWNGMTPCDLVFPFFLFIVGVSMYLSMKKTEFKPSMPLVWKIIRRTIILFALGTLLHAWDAWIWGEENILENLRIWSVLGRIALAYGVASFILLIVHQPRQLLSIAFGLLALYSIIIICGNGYAQDETNLAAIIDRALVGEAHLYHKSPVDPEGLLGVISSVAHVLIGVVIGKFMIEKTDFDSRLTKIFTLAFTIGIIGYLASFGLPLNKRIWSPSYVLVTCSLASGILALLIQIIDKSGHDRWCQPFRIFGMNALFLYVLSEALAAILWRMSIPEAAYSFFFSMSISPEWSSTLYALLLDSFMLLIAWGMWKMKWFIKL